MPEGDPNETTALMSLLSHRLHAGDPTRVFYGFNGVATFCYTLTFTVNLIYMVTVVGLDPLQMGLVAPSWRSPPSSSRSRPASSLTSTVAARRSSSDSR